MTSVIDSVRSRGNPSFRIQFAKSHWYVKVNSLGEAKCRFQTKNRIVRTFCRSVGLRADMRFNGN